MLKMLKKKITFGLFLCKTKKVNKISINLNAGDLIIYRGNKLSHWREPFLGKNHAQVFLHYNIDNIENKINKYDGRPFLGLPEKFRNKACYENQYENQ